MNGVGERVEDRGEEKWGERQREERRDGFRREGRGGDRIEEGEERMGGRQRKREKERK